ncbi:MAG: hypothetical protein JKY49_00550 [Cohaesibacteraceae bacterium]|nr:hypothetical protein [Cohaesibacteraceae bacterium]MBL4876204.1 hypothetical protein [Cohaesibacteraceae bacterium]
MAKSETVIIKNGIAEYPALANADYKFDAELGTYKCNIKLPYDDAKRYMAQIAEIYKEHTGKPASLSKSVKGLWSFEEDEDGENTGDVIFKISVKNKKKKDGSLWDRKPFLMDANTDPVALGVEPSGGSVLTVKAEIYCWEYQSSKGVSLQPVAVQILKLVQRSNGADASGFEKSEGFTSPQNDTPQQDVSGDDGDY